MKATNILIVEDNPFNIDILVDVFKDEYTAFVAIDQESVFAILESQTVNIILMDIYLKDASGIDIVREIRNNDRYTDIPVIFATSEMDPNVKLECFQLGAADYITKPYNKLEVIERVKSRLDLISLNNQLQEQNAMLDTLVEMRTRKIIQTRDAAINAVISLVETRDDNTAHHITRTIKFVDILAKQLLKMDVYREDLTPEFLSNITRASTLHDIGKIGIPDKVLLKNGKLTDDEFEMIKTHTIIGFEALESSREGLENDGFFSLARDIVLYHHEKWNGRGYPSGKRGKEIPLSARLMALADVYDALTSKRVYKDAFTHEKAREIIVSESNVSFDPHVVKAFINAEKMFEKINYQFMN